MDKVFLIENILKANNLFWQYPVITEETFYHQNKNNSNFFGFPWATCIDKRINTNGLVKLLIKIKEENKKYYTCCQHISFRKYINLFKVLGITIVYTPHKIKNEDVINGVTILPCPLYACNFEDLTRNTEFKNVDFLQNERKYLYSFIGGVQKDYLTNIRNNILKMNHPNNSIVENSGDWHFNTTVYSKLQNHHKELNINDNHILKTKKYNNILIQSRFSLCPSGSGPNSIRFWESLACGAIPVLLADTLELPQNINWDEIIIKIQEKDYNKILDILSKISHDDENKRRRKCIETYNRMKNNFRGTLLNTKKEEKKTLFTSYLCNKEEPIIQDILLQWKLLNPNYNILYFSDCDVEDFFRNTQYYDTYKKMKNGVAIADFFRICYINKYGGFWFDIDIEPVQMNITNNYNINLFDCGFGNISYMLIGGRPKQRLFDHVIHKVNENIEKNIPNKYQHILDITGPRIIQNLLFEKLNIINEDNNFKGTKEEKIYLKNTEYEFCYSKIELHTQKTDTYKILQQKYKKMNYQHYDFV